MFYRNSRGATGASQGNSRAVGNGVGALDPRGTFARLLLAALLLAAPASADEGGASFWLPGQYGSFAAIAPAQGFSLPMQTYFYSGSAGGSTDLDRGGAASFGLDTTFVARFFVPTWTPRTQVLGGQPSLSLGFFPGWNKVSADIAAGDTRDGQTDSVTGLGDLYPMAQLFWVRGKHHWMTYVTGNIPVGAYNPERLANLGLGHAAIDAGGAYTYLNPETGWEYSATAGLTYNFRNPDTDQTSGIDSHLDLGLSRSLSEALFVGLVGYAYVQLTPDDGQPSALGTFESQTFALGPQLGYSFKVAGHPVSTNLRGYLEFATQNRPEGGSVFLTINIPIGQAAAHPQGGQD